MIKNRNLFQIGILFGLILILITSMGGSVSASIVADFSIKDECGLQGFEYPHGDILNLTSVVTSPDGEVPVKWKWEFSNPAYPTLYGPNVIIGPVSGPDSFDIQLTVIGNEGSTYTTPVKAVDIFEKSRNISANFSYVNDYDKKPLNVRFIDQSETSGENIIGWYWNISGIVHANTQIPEQVLSDGSHDVSLVIVTDKGNMARVEKPIDVYSLPSDNGINFTWVQEYGKTAYSAVLIPLGITSDWKINWSIMKDGIAYAPVTGSSGFTPRYDLPETGIYTVAMNASKNGYITKDITQQMEVFPNVPPIPEMSMENTNAPFKAGINSAFGYVGEPIQFWSNTSNSMEDSWFWDFGDNTSSPLRSPVHSYSAPGLYTVTLKASNVKGETSADVSDELYSYHPYFIHDTYNVWILNSIQVNPTASPITGTVPLPVQFDAQVSVNGKLDAESRQYLNKWYWDFGYYGVSDEERPTYTYNNPGTYYPYVWVQMINDYWTWHGWTVNPITVSPNTPIDAGFTYEEIDRTGTYGYSYKFMDTSRGYYTRIASWSWDFGDGTPLSTEPAPTHMFKEPGIYTVTLTVADSVSPIPNSAKFSKVISVSQNTQSSPLAAFNADVQSGFVPLTVQFNDQSSGDIKQWNWNFGDGQISHAQSPKHHYLLPGVFDVSLEVIDFEGNIGKIIKSAFIEVKQTLV